MKIDKYFSWAILILVSSCIGFAFWLNYGLEKDAQISDTYDVGNKQTGVMRENNVIDQPGLSLGNGDAVEYSNLDLSLQYPNDGTYGIEESSVDHFVIYQSHPGIRIHVQRSADHDFGQNLETKTINDKKYEKFERVGMGDPYGYIIERNGTVYTFESTSGPENSIFESIMETVTFN